MLVNQIQIGIISVDDSNAVTICNTTAEQIAGVKGLKNWKMVHATNPGFSIPIDQLGAHGRKLMEINAQGDRKIFAVDVKTLIILGKPHRLITFQDINSEIEQKEIEAWHKLIRILTHEIMNSVTPISSLTETMQTLLQDRQGKPLQSEQIKNETIADLIFSIQTIHRRSEGLLNFVEDYRKVTKVPQPVLEKTSLNELLQQVSKLMGEELGRHGIKLSVSVEDRIQVVLDPKMVEQVLINLITNAMHSLKGRGPGSIGLEGRDTTDRIIIEVTDNGKGIPEKQLQEIFIPFFSTKKEGSGIGLSLSRQIMSLHGGSIKVDSNVGEGTRFTLSFPKN